MKWKKIGKIFNPVDHKLINNCHDFAQSPQALVFDNFVRIYFSTRERDSSGKFLSHIAFVDMDKNLKKIIKVSEKNVIKLGELGCYDEHGIFPLNVLRDGDRILGYIGGWSRRTSVSVETSIGLATSDDGGLTFKRIGNGPVLSSSLNEPFLVGDPFVKKYGPTYHMWYIYGVNWKQYKDDSGPQRIYKIGYAKSDDGVNWVKFGKQIITDKLNLDECQALPTVFFHKNKYHMYFCYRQASDFRKNKGNSYRIGYAYSDDLEGWVRSDDLAGIDVSGDGWDSDMQCYPHVFHCDNKFYMLYNGNEFGKYGFGLAELES